eukprot:523279_1
MNYLIICAIMFLSNLTNADIFHNYVVLDAEIKSMLIQIVIEDDFTAFNSVISELGFDTNKSSLLFDAISRTASPQLGPGLSFGQFERRSTFTQNDVEENVELTHLVNARNIALTLSNGIKFQYSGIYKVTVQFRPGHSGADSATFHMARIVGIVHDSEVGRSVLCTSGYYGTYSTQTLTFLINIDKVDDVYMLQFLKESNSFTVPAYSGSSFNNIQPTTTFANIMVVVEHIGHL